MQVKNDAPFAIIAVCHFMFLGRGEKKFVHPNTSAEVLGPPIGKIEGRICYAVMAGEITCRNNPNKPGGFHVDKNQPLVIEKKKASMTIRHYLDPENHTDEPEYHTYDRDQK